jgi:glutamate formiminotransferase/formiminotetrahydrofolate cyclodeaminase
MAAALAAMAARLTIGKKKYAGMESRMQEIAVQADELRKSLEAAVRLDAEALSRSWRCRCRRDRRQKTARGSHRQRDVQGDEVPLEVAWQVVSVLELIADVAEQGNVNSITDAASGAAMARAALTAAGMNVRVNTRSYSDPNVARQWLERLIQLEAQALQAHDRIQTALRERGGLE